MIHGYAPTGLPEEWGNDRAFRTMWTKPRTPTQTEYRCIDNHSYGHTNTMTQHERVSYALASKINLYLAE